jgi:hypothetical protein
MPVAPEMLGRFVWHDLMTTDVSHALSFYLRLFPEWSAAPHEMAGGVTYHLIQAAGFEIGGVVSIPSDAGLSSHWIGYVAVDDCTAAVRRAEANGGRCIVPVVSVPNVGKFAVIQDAKGAALKVFEVTDPFELPPMPTAGQFAWDELLAKDLPSERRFFEAVCGWSSLETVIPQTGPYALFKVGERDVAGALAMPPNIDSPASWLSYLSAEDVDARSAQAIELGATTCVSPRDIPGIGRFAVLADPTGAMFALFHMIAHA